MSTTTKPTAIQRHDSPIAGPTDSRRHLPRINISPTERAGRLVIGLVAVVAGALLLPSAASALAVVLEVLLVLAGLDLIVTGALGHCPLYARLGHVPKTFRRPS